MWKIQIICTCPFRRGKRCRFENSRTHNSLELDCSFLARLAQPEGVRSNQSTNRKYPRCPSQALKHERPMRDDSLMLDSCASDERDAVEVIFSSEFAFVSLIKTQAYNLTGTWHGLLLESRAADSVENVSEEISR